jgi:DNA-binding XRE family transcriptional regulator
MKKRTRNEEFGRRRELIPAAEVRRVRAAHGMTQERFAVALCLTPRTIVRGEQRGLYIPMRGDTRRPEVYVNWCRLAREAAPGGRRGPGR